MKIKVCGMTRPHNIKAVADLEPDFLGFIFYTGSPRHVTPADIASVMLSENIIRTGVFVNADFGEIVRIVHEANLQAVQLHGNESPQICNNLKKRGLTVIKAFGIDSAVDWTAMQPYENSTDYFLFDTRSPQHGGTGRQFDWGLLAAYPHSKPYFLSGGISQESIPEIIRLADSRLIGVDLNSRFEDAPGLKNIALLQKAIELIKIQKKLK